MKKAILEVREIEGHLGTLRNILSSDSIPLEKYSKDSGMSSVRCMTESQLMEEEKASFIIYWVSVQKWHRSYANKRFSAIFVLTPSKLYV